MLYDSVKWHEEVKRYDNKVLPKAMEFANSLRQEQIKSLSPKQEAKIKFALLYMHEKYPKELANTARAKGFKEVTFSNKPEQAKPEPSKNNKMAAMKAKISGLGDQIKKIKQKIKDVVPSSPRKNTSADRGNGMGGL